MLLLAAGQSHLTLLLTDGKIFDRLFRGSFLREMRKCPMCLGCWTAAALCLSTGFYFPEQILFVAGLGHVLFLLREKFLPCDKCKLSDPIPFKLINTEENK